MCSVDSSRKPFWEILLKEVKKPHFWNYDSWHKNLGSQAINDEK